MHEEFLKDCSVYLGEGFLFIIPVKVGDHILDTYQQFRLRHGSRQSGHLVQQPADPHPISRQRHRSRRDITRRRQRTACKIRYAQRVLCHRIQNTPVDKIYLKVLMSLTGNSGDKFICQNLRSLDAFAA